MKTIKLGGSLLEDATRRAESLRSIADDWNAGEDIVLVHGGGKHIDALLARVGIARRMHAGLRVTDGETLPIVVAVLAGSVNKMLVSELAAIGVRAAGISGADAGTLIAKRRGPIDGVDLGHVGEIHHCDATLIHALLGQRILPVISSVAIDTSGALLNVNADTAAAAVAVAVNAESLIFVTDVPGVLDGSGVVVPSLNAKKVRSLIRTKVVTGGMRPKLEAALHALSFGVKSIVIGEGGTELVAA